MDGMPDSFTVSSGKGISSLGKLPRSQMAMSYPVCPPRRESTGTPGVRFSSTVSPGSRSSIPASSLASTTRASSSAVGHDSDCSSAVSRLVAVRVRVPVAALASKSVPRSDSSGESAGAMAAALWAVLSSSARFIVMFKISSFTQQSRRG